MVVSLVLYIGLVGLVGVITNINIDTAKKEVQASIEKGITLTVCHEYLAVGSKVIHCTQQEAKDGNR